MDDDETPNTDAEAGAIPVPQQLRNPHRVVAELRDGKRQIATPNSLRLRALRIAQALAVAAEARGWTVQSIKEARTRWGHEWGGDDLFVINTGETSEGLRFIQENDRTLHVPTKQELAAKQRWQYTSIPKYDYTPSSRLKIELSTNWDGRRRAWADRERWSLDDKLDRVLDEIECRSRAAREERFEREKVEAEKQQRIAITVERAKVRLVEAHRAETLIGQLKRWQLAEELRAYLSAVERHIGSLDEAAAKDASEWLSWSRGYTKRVDPLTSPIGMPDDPEPTAESLRPFMS